MGENTTNTDRERALALIVQRIENTELDLNVDLSSISDMVKAALTTPQWQPIETAPRDGTEIETDMGLVFWSERPVCMLGTRNGGFPAGWATARGSGTDYNLPVDPPTKWKPITPPSTRGDT